MSWDIALQMLQETAQVEYRIFQRGTIPGTDLWRRHTGYFNSVENALFSQNGALQALEGQASYPKRYAAGTELDVAYVATWLSGSTVAFLARQSTPEPEVTIVPVPEVDEVQFNDAAALTNHLAAIFGTGARTYGVRFFLDSGKLLRDDRKCASSWIRTREELARKKGVGWSNSRLELIGDSL